MKIGFHWKPVPPICNGGNVFNFGKVQTVENGFVGGSSLESNRLEGLGQVLLNAAKMESSEPHDFISGFAVLYVNVCEYGNSINQSFCVIAPGSVAICQVPGVCYNGLA